MDELESYGINRSSCRPYEILMTQPKKILMAISIKEKPVLKKKPYGLSIRMAFSQNKHGADKEEAWQTGRYTKKYT